MKKVTTLLILFSFLGFVNAQSIDDQCKKIETVKGNSLSVDPNGNLYVVDGSSLYKLNSEGAILSHYSNLLLGDISSVDVENPLKIMLFYRDESMILFLDDQLIPVGEALSLLENGYPNVNLATYSTDNSIWLYEPVVQDLINVSFKLQELSRSHISLSSFQPTSFVSSQEKQLVMFNPSTGLVCFDAFGTYLKTWQFENADSWRQVNGRLVYFLRKIVDNSMMEAANRDSYELCAYNYATLQDFTIASLPYVPLLDAAYANGCFYFIDQNNFLNILKINELNTQRK